MRHGGIGRVVEGIPVRDPQEVVQVVVETVVGEIVIVEVVAAEIAEATILREISIR